jgi:hypothetical protein
MTPFVITKIIINNLTGFAVGRASRNFISVLVPAASKYPVLRILTKTSVFVTSWIVSDMIHEHIRRHTQNKLADFEIWWKTNVTTKLNK